MKAENTNGMKIIFFSKKRKKVFILIVKYVEMKEEKFFTIVKLSLKVLVVPSLPNPLQVRSIGIDKEHN